MRAIDGYILKQLTSVSLFVTVALTTAVWLSQSLRFMDLIVNKGLPVTDFVLFLTFLLPGFLGLVVPIAIFVAVLFVYNRLNNESELIVMRGAGLSPYRIGRPAIVLGLAGTVLTYGIALYALPASYHAFKNLQYEIRHDVSAVLLEAGRFNRLSDDLTVYIRARSASGQLQGVLVHDTRGDGEAVTMMAQEGALVTTETGPRVVLVDGNRQIIDPDTGNLSMLYFDRYTVDLGQLQTAMNTRWRQPRERYLPNLLVPGPGPDDQRFKNELIAEGHRRLTFPLYVLVYTGIALAAILAGPLNRHGKSRRIAVAVVTVGVLQAAQMAMTDLATRNLAFVPAMYALAILGILTSMTIGLSPRARRLFAGLTTAAVMMLWPRRRVP